MSCDTACPIHLSICIRQCITSYICSYIAGVVPSFSNIRFTPTRNACGSEAQLRAARSQARALATAAAPRLVVFFSPPTIPARHTSHLSRPSSSNKHHLLAGVHIQAHMVRHSPHPILSAGIVHGPALLWSHLFASRPSHLRLSGLRGLSCRVAPRST